MANKIKHFYSKLLQIGLPEGAQFKEKLRVELSNQFIALGLACVFLHNIVNLIFLHSWVDFWLTTVWFMVLGSGLFFNLINKPLVARISLAFGGILAVFTLHLLFGAGLKLESMYILFLVVAALFFEFSLMVKYAILTVISLILAIIINSYIQPPFEELVNPSGAFTRFVFSVTMIVSLIGKLILENRRYNTLVVDQNEHLKEYNKRLKTFNYIVSHDLKEPLRGIVGFSQLIKKDFDKGRGVEVDYLNHIIRSTKQLNTLVGNLKDFIDSSEKEISTEICRMDEIVDEISQSSTFIRAENKGMICCKPFPPFVASKMALTIILRNLIENGLKYNDKEQPKISINGEISKGIANIRITDNGNGIEEKYFADIFEMFTRLNVDYKQEKGTGIGLNIAENLIKRIGGEICILESEVNKGSTFQISFPVEIMKEA